jgi:hypothetical protein
VSGPDQRTLMAMCRHEREACTPRANVTKEPFCYADRSVGGQHAMTIPTIQALGITRHWSATHWKASGYVEGVGWLEAWGTSPMDAMEVLQTLAAQRVAEQEAEAEPC